MSPIFPILCCALFFLCGLAGCAMVVTGALPWALKK
jgi:hypothetical protein